MAAIRHRSFCNAGRGGNQSEVPPRQWVKMTTIEGRSWVTIVPQDISQNPRARSRKLRRSGNARAAHKVLRDAGAMRSRDEADLVEFLLVLLDTDEFKGPRERLETMVETLWNAPTTKPQAAFNIMLTACAREAARVSDNSSVKRGVILKTAETTWNELLRSVKNPDPRNTALMYRVCGECKHLELAKRVRTQVNDPAEGIKPGDGSPSEAVSSEAATAAYILCLGKCGRSLDAEKLYFSEGNRKHRSSDKVLSALFQAYVASNRISKAESLIAMYGSSFLSSQSCNAFVKQCAALRLHETAVEFVGRMSRSKETGFPRSNARTYNLLLRGLSAGTGSEDREVAADRALVVVEQMKGEGIEPTTVTYNTLIRSLVFRDQIEEAFQLYRAMESPNRITFSHLMQGAAKVKDMHLASETLAALEKHGERPNYGFCKSYLEVVARVRGVEAAFSEAMRISEQFGEALVFGDVGSHEAIRMALISACGKVKDLRKAFDALHLKLARHSNGVGDGNLAPLYIATVLMQVCLQCDAPGRALEVFYSLKSAGLHPNFEVYESLIYGLCSYVRASSRQKWIQERQDAEAGDLEREEVNGSSSVSSVSFGQSDGEFDETERVSWRHSSLLHEKAVVPQRLMFAKEEPGPEEALRVAVELLREMHECNEGRPIRQAAYVYNTLIAAAAGVGDFELALQIFNKMSWRNNPGVVYFSKGERSIANGDRNLQTLPKGKKISEQAGLAELASMGTFESEFEFPAATVGTYNSMIDAAWKCGEPWFSFEVFEMMQMDRISEPNAATLSLLADIALSESETVSIESQQHLLKQLDHMSILSPEVCRKRVQLRQKLLALRWS